MSDARHFDGVAVHEVDMVGVEEQVHLEQVAIIGQHLLNDQGDVVQEAPDGCQFVVVTASNGEEYVIQVDLSTDLTTLTMEDITASQEGQHEQSPDAALDAEESNAAPIEGDDDVGVDEPAPVLDVEGGAQRSSVTTTVVSYEPGVVVGEVDDDGKLDEEEEMLEVDGDEEDGARLVHPNKAKQTGPRILKRRKVEPVDVKGNVIGLSSSSRIMKLSGGRVRGGSVKHSAKMQRTMLRVQGVNGDPEMQPLPDGRKGRRARVEGNAQCPQCDQKFVNNARLERHLHVHQVFGSYLCPLCGKTYKYEYNLFYHWRKTCKELDNVLDTPKAERKNMDTNKLRSLVDDATSRVASEGRTRGHASTMETTGAMLDEPSTVSPNARMDLPESRKGTTCNKCGVVMLSGHYARHMDVHDGVVPMDNKSVGATWFCELCGLMYRARENLLKHWRGGCTEIQARIDPTIEMTLNNEELVMKVEQMFHDKSAQYMAEHPIDQTTGEPISNKIRVRYEEDDETIDMSDGPPPPLLAPCELPASKHAHGSTADAALEPTETVVHHVVHEEVLVEQQTHQMDGDVDHMDVDVETVQHKSGLTSPRHTILQHRQQAQSSGRAIIVDGSIDATGMARYDNAWNEQIPNKYVVEAASAGYTVSHSGELVGPLGLPQTTTPRAKWSMLGGPVSCPECYRTFANQGRLERHRQGFHNSYGQHHCILCGNRFKYDYNLLYHYRHSCPYTKAFIEETVRLQMDSTNIRKLVKQLSNKHLNVAPAEMDKMLTEAASGQIAHQMGAEELSKYADDMNDSYATQSLYGATHQTTACQLCPQQFNTMPLLMKHMERSHPDYQIVMADEDYEQPTAQEPTVFQMELNVNDEAASAVTGDTLLMENVEYTVVRNDASHAGENEGTIVLHLQQVEPHVVEQVVNAEGDVEEEAIIVQHRPMKPRAKNATPNHNTVAHKLHQEKMREQKEAHTPVQPLGESIQTAQSSRGAVMAGQLKCPHCDKIFRTSAHRLRHVQREHSELAPQAEGPIVTPSLTVGIDGRYRCHLGCSTASAFRTQDALRAHWTTRACAMVKANSEKTWTSEQIVELVCQIETQQQQQPHPMVDEPTETVETTETVESVTTDTFDETRVKREQGAGLTSPLRRSVRQHKT